MRWWWMYLCEQCGAGFDGIRWDVGKELWMLDCPFCKHTTSQPDRIKTTSKERDKE